MNKRAMVNIFNVRINEKENSISRKTQERKKEDHSLLIPFCKAIQIIFLSFIILEHVNSGLRR